MSTDQPEEGTFALRQRILVIDDDPVVGLSCRRALCPDGHEVECFSDPQAGLQAALSGDFDLLLVDLVMPDMDGLEVLKRVKSAGVPSEVVLITAYPAVESAVEAMKEGATDYLAKPFSPSRISSCKCALWAPIRIQDEPTWI